MHVGDLFSHSWHSEATTTMEKSKLGVSCKGCGEKLESYSRLLTHDNTCEALKLARNRFICNICGIFSREGGILGDTEKRCTQRNYT